MTALERDYEPRLMERIQNMFPGCLILKNDSSYRPGVPDRIILFGTAWGVLEVKREEPTSESDWQPNQPYYLRLMNNMSFAAVIYPENEEEVLDALRQAFTPRR